MRLTIVIKTKMPDDRWDHQIHDYKSGHLIIGRSEGDILLSDPKCSRQHALLYETGEGTLCVRDLNSRNGTFLGKARVVDDCAVAQGDEIRIGGTLIEILKVQADHRAHRAPARKRVRSAEGSFNEVTETSHGIIHRWPENLYCLPKDKQVEYAQYVNPEPTAERQASRPIKIKKVTAK